MGFVLEPNFCFSHLALYVFIVVVVVIFIVVAVVVCVLMVVVLVVCMCGGGGGWMCTLTCVQTEDIQKQATETLQGQKDTCQTFQKAGQPLLHWPPLLSAAPGLGALPKHFPYKPLRFIS